ncbi:hypothetical protein D1J36_001390 [Riemerella anatipestifer]|uniref:hypothetical protein n=1 Tax=Riemerella anatipestifer TaxID=34085 RepID=UPI0012AE143D|nr:hypothetical protein [Riemerella anatipestifer]USL95791.1 hypothetical protein D1J36_001390 [Riemerella anatipestifer]
MKQLFLGLCLLITGYTQTYAARKSGNVERIKVVAELPKTNDYAIDGTDDYIDLGILYGEFVIKGSSFWITKEPVLVGVSSKYNDVYYNLSPQDINWIIKENQLPPAEELKKLSFYDRYSGLVIFILVIIGTVIYAIIYYSRNPKNKQE